MSEDVFSSLFDFYSTPVGRVTAVKRPKPGGRPKVITHLQMAAAEAVDLSEILTSLKAAAAATGLLLNESGGTPHAETQQGNK